jgi:hypothetical protein
MPALFIVRGHGSYKCKFQRNAQHLSQNHPDAPD